MELALGGAPLAALLARPAAAILALAWASGALPPLASLAVAATVALSLAFFQLPALTFEGAWALTQSAPQTLALELVRGVVLGLGAAAPLWAAITAGGWAGQRWRLGGDASPVTALYAAMLGVAFVAVDGPVLVCAALARSYAAAPLGAPLLASGLDVMAVAGWLETAVRLCLPLLGAVAVAELAVAAATRAGAAVAVAWPSAVLAPALVLLVTAPLVPLLVGALAAAVRRGLS